MNHGKSCFCEMCRGDEGASVDANGVCFCLHCGPDGAIKGWHSLSCSCPDCQAEIGGLTPGERTPLDDICHVVNCRVREITEYVKTKGDQMDVGRYANNGGGNYPDPLPPAAIGRKDGDKGKGKILAVREVEGKKKMKKGGYFSGLALDVKVKGTKYSFLTAFDRFDIGAIVNQLGETDTDEWLGKEITFVLKKGKKGKRLFVNVFNPGGKGRK